MPKTSGKPAKSGSLPGRSVVARAAKMSREGGAGKGVGPTFAPIERPLHDPGRLPRDVFPLPFIAGQVPLARRVSRGCRQRIGLKNHKVEDVNAAIWALNSMYNGAGVSPLGGGPANSFGGTSAAQAEVIHRIQHAVEALGPPPGDLTIPEALRSLRCGGYTDLGQSVGALTNYQPDLVSLPEAGWQPINLDALGGKVRGRSISSFIQEQLLPAETAHMKVKDSGVERPYSDPRFRDPRVYGDFVSRLLQSSIVDLSMQDGRERIGLFFVSKKANKLRLIIDARRSNSHFRPPSYVHLATGETLSRLEVEPETELTICTADLKDAFYHLALPEELRTYFTLAPIDGKFLSVKEVGGQRVKPGVMYYPRLAVVPMGWSWALYICQTLHENLVAQAGLGDDTRLRDKRPCPTSGYVHTEYVDNLMLIGTCREQVVSAFQHAVNALKDAGLQVHEDEVCEGDTCVLGWQFTRDGKFGPSSRRVWKVRFAIKGVIARRRATGREIERIVGHASFICLARRESLSIFGEVYRFIQRHRNHSGEVRLPRLVRHELELWSAVSPLIRVDLQAQWSTDVTAVDASFFGLGAVTSKMPLDLVRSLGRWNERWRFADEGARKARDLAKEGSHTSIMFEDEYPGLSGHQPLLLDTEAFGLQEARFQNVPFEVVDREWTTLISHRWRRVPTLPVGEARGALFAAKHALRNTHNFGRRHLILTDALTAAGAFSRGRSSVFPLRRVCQQLGALALGSGSTFHFRWIPSEHNPADNPSRGKWKPSTPTRLSHGDPSPPDRGAGTCATPDRREGLSQEEGATNGPPSDGSDRGCVRCDECGPEKASQEGSSSGGGAPRRHGHRVGTSIDQRCLPQTISSYMGLSPEPSAGQSWQAQRYGGGRRDRHVPLRRAVHGRRGPVNGAVHCGRDPVLQPGVAGPSCEQTPSCKAVVNRVAEVGAGQEQVACAVRSCGTDGNEGFQMQVEPDRPLPPPGFRPLPQALRGPQVAGTGHGTADSPTGAIQSLDFCAPSCRRPSPIQDPGVRRESPTGSRLPSGSGRGVISMPQAGNQKSARNRFQPRHRDSEQVPSRVQSGALFEAPGPHAPVQAASRRSIARFRTSVRRYQKGGRLVQLFNSLTKDVRKKATQAAEELPQVLRYLR